MKKFITLFTLATYVLCSSHATTTASAQTTFISSTQTETVPIGDGDYLETIILNTPTNPSDISIFSTAKTITKTKVTMYKNKNGSVLWSVSIHATFTYDGNTAKCISCSHSTTCSAQTWKIKAASSSKSGNSATAKATATHSFNNISRDFTKSVTISCSKNGSVS